MMQKLRKLFISSFKWRLLINITLSYLVAFLIYSILGIIFDRIIPIAVPNEMRYALCYAISFIVFVEIFFKLIDFTIEYIRKLRTFYPAGNKWQLWCTV